MDVITRTILNIPSLSTLPGRIAEGELPALITGTSPALRALLAAALRRETGRPVLVLSADESESSRMAADLRFLTGEECPQLLSRDLTLRGADVVSRQGEQGRLRIFDALSNGGFGVVAATAASLMQRTLPPEILRETAFTINMNGPGPEELENRLLRCGYKRCDMVEGPGQYSRRGGIVDIFSPGSPQPLRVEYWGDDVDSMGVFDTDSQRRTENVENFRILPAGEALTGLSPAGEEELIAALRQQAKRCSRRKDIGEQMAKEILSDISRIEQQLSLPWADRYLPFLYPDYATALDYFPADTLILMDAPGRCSEQAEEYYKQLSEDCELLSNAALPVLGAEDYALGWAELCENMAAFGVVMADAFTAGRYPLRPKSLMETSIRQLPSYGGSVETALEDMQHYLEQRYHVVLLASDKRRADVLAGMLERNGIRPLRDFPGDVLPPAGRCTVTVGGLSSGLEIPEAALAILTDTQMMAPGLRTRKKKKAVSNRERISSCADLSVGDLVVHETYGIGRFAGIFKIPVDGAEKDYVKINYAGTDSLYVPATQLDMVSKYVGAGEEKVVKLSKMSGNEWQRTKTRTRAAVKELAQGLLKLYAQRKNTPGHAFSADQPWQTEFEENFGYAETDDQLRCIREIKADMESAMPMDRLLCGDVGYGKTEVALRAVMKCILDNKQAVLLCPTTVLARQHYQTASHRFFGYPVTVDVLSRFKTANQLKQTLMDVKSGKVDLLIGTHRLLQKDIKFKDLGLVIVDEEQRFGVTHKEKLKELTKGVDVLTLSATPIPRTLNMALSGLRSMSTLEEPPHNRQSVRTFVMEHSWPAVIDAMRRELNRGGQVYYLHNRVENIERTALRIREMLDGASVAVAHGKMDQEQLGRVMDDMVEGKIQVLVCTTIIETGIDIPNVNTLIIEDADKLGLAQLHQIRGRVGRSARRASAYLTYRKDKTLTEVAEKRLSAIREFAEFNAGFQIAMRDLEIRGAGNLLGAEQSGHMIDVGYDLYLKLLEEAVQEEKGEKPAVRTECAADLSVSANIPEKYVPSAEQRMELYRSIALIRTEDDADDLTDELIDRFGDPPSSVNALVHVALLRGEAGRAGISDIAQKGSMLRFEIVDFDMERISALYALPAFKNRIKVEAGKTPRLSLKLRAGERVIEAARSFVAAWADTERKEETT